MTVPRFSTALLLLNLAGVCQASPWSEAVLPAPGEPRSIGPTNNGCIAGAQDLPLQGEGYAVMHLERRRYFGHPLLVQALQELGRQAAQQGIGPVLVGDLGQAMGGPMPSGHRSHQTGLDVDVWFALDPVLLASADDKRANVSAPSLLNAAGNGLDRKKWSSQHAALLETAAGLSGVDRIFVNPYIKKELCETVTGRRAWLHKIRPWYRHDDHFHLRLACPADSPLCESQEPIPAGEGCDASLDWWFQPHPPGPHGKPEMPPLPTACLALLSR